jgi:hypothetical protein
MTESNPLQRLNAARHALLRLHKVLLDAQRNHYEKQHGRVGSSGEMLQLVISDENFAWLHPISELIVQIDTATDDDDQPLTPDAAQTLLQQMRALLTPHEGGTGFARHYFDAIQSDPNISYAHGQVMTAMK